MKQSLFNRYVILALLLLSKFSLLGQDVSCFYEPNSDYNALSGVNPPADVPRHFGIGVIVKRKNRKILNLNKKNFAKLKFEEYFYNYKDYMNIIEFDELIKII